MLGRSTPEGARDYLVPSRVQPGMFYALPQSPQLYKQILMVAGYDRYIQVARCFRDEDLRADRQPEFTQFDLEMSFITAEDIIGVIDGLVARLAKEILGLDVPLPLPRMSYDEAMERFGHDAPDLRFGMELVDISDLAARRSSRCFAARSRRAAACRGINAKGAADRYSRKGHRRADGLHRRELRRQGTGLLQGRGRRQAGLAHRQELQPDLLAEIGRRMDAAPGDLLLLVADKFETTCKALYALRKRLGAELKLYDPATMHFSWIVEFPMFASDTEENGWTAMHHPFTAPRPQDRELLADRSRQKCRAQAYDLVINGYEAGGGTIRIHDQQLQQQVFRLLGIDEPTARERFGFLLDALQYGAPPHGGIALGIDRLVMLFAGLDSIRDVHRLPQDATRHRHDDRARRVDARQLRELSIKVGR